VLHTSFPFFRILGLIVKHYVCRHDIFILANRAYNFGLQPLKQALFVVVILDPLVATQVFDLSFLPLALIKHVL
jgi:hypothetical protein